MPDESYKNYGVSPQVQNKCFIYKEPIQQICSECSYATLERIHSRCSSGFEIMSRIEPPIQIFPITTI